MFDAYIICTSPRSGSTLLCELLTQSRVAGRPRSYFHKPSLSDWQKGLGLVSAKDQPRAEILEAVFAQARRLGADGSDLFGARLQRHSFAFFSKMLAAHCPNQRNDADRIAAVFGKTRFVHLTRRDKLDQAISYVKAQQSGLWHQAPDGREIERLSEAQPLVFDRAQIARQRDDFHAMDLDWAAWFAKQGLTPFRIEYDDLSTDPIGVTKALLKDLGKTPDPASLRQLPVAKLADETNREWKARFERGETANPASTRQN